MMCASFILRISLVTFFIIHCSCAIENVEILKCYENYYNKENTNFTYEDGILYNKENLDTGRYKIEITIKVKDQANPKSFLLLKCAATLSDNAGILRVEENHCDDGTSGGRSNNEASDVSSELEYNQDETTELSTTESDVGRQALNLDSEVQSDNVQNSSSEEQFVAIPRQQPSSPCIGCSSLVDNNAPGVEGLANLAIRHLNKHTPDTIYKLKSVLQVERQVQVVNGVRFILTLDVSDLNCVETQVEDCSRVKTCKVSILEKPWLKIPNGNKFRAVLSNNCTEQWLFGEEGEELSNKDEDVTNSDDEVIKVNKNFDVQATPNSERKLTGQELKELEDQIIPSNEIERQKRYVKTESGIEEDLEPKSVYLLDLAIEAFERYSSKRGLQIRVVYATRQLSVDSVITRIDFNVRVVEPKVEDLKNEVNMRCHTRVSENNMNDKSFDTYCIYFNDAHEGVIELPASDPKFSPIAREKLRSEYGKLLQFDEVIRVYVNLGAKFRQNIIFDAKSTANIVYRCYLHIEENLPPLLCKKVESNHRIEKDPTAIKYFHLATEALRKHLIHTHITEPYIVAVVMHASELDGPLTDIDIDFIAVDFDAALRCVSQIQENEKSHKIDVNCSTITERKDYPAGVIIERNPLDTKYIKMAEEVLEKKYAHLDPKDLRVVYANEQLLKTLVTRIDVEISNKNSEGVRCHIKLSQKPSEKEKDVNVDCFPKSKEIFGGDTDQNASDPKNWKTAEEALMKKYNNSIVLLDVVRVTTQFVSGVIYKTDFYAISPLHKLIYHCHSKKVEQKNLSEFTVDCQPKKDHHLIGGIQEKDPSDPKYKAIAIEALAKEYRAYSTESLKIVYANEQLVSGLITRLDFDIKEKNNALVFRCHVKLFEKPWESVKELYIDCFPKSLNMPGGRFEHNASDPKNWKHAEESLTKEYNSSLSLLDVIRVTTAVGAGFTTETDFYAISNSDKAVQQCHSLKFDQLWGNISNIITKCVTIEKKHVPGDIIERDPRDPKLKAVASMALKTKYPDLANHNLSVVYANEQITNVLITRIDFDVSDVHKISDYRCHLKSSGLLFENERNITILCFDKGTDGRKELNASDPRNWQDAQKSLAKQYGTSLTLLDVLRVTTHGELGGNETDFDALSKSSNVVYRCYNTIFMNVHFKDTELSCEPVLHKPVIYKTSRKIKKDPSDPEFSELANKSLIQFLAAKNISKPYRVAQVTHVSEYVTEGTRTDIYFIAVLNNNTVDTLKCVSNIWERISLKRAVINVDCSFVMPRPRSKRKPGNKSHQDPKNPIYLSLARKSLNQYLDSENVETLYNITIEEVTTQLVAGVSTDIYFSAISIDNSGGHKCHSNIWERGWIRSLIINVKCSPLETIGRKKRETNLLGGKTPQDPNNPEYLSLARTSLSQYLNVRDTSNRLQITIEQVTTQVVAGVKIDIDFIAKYPDNAGGYKCHSNVFKRAWLNSTIIDVNCSPLQSLSRKKRGSNLLGGKTPQDPNNPEYLSLARTSLSQYLNEQDTSNRLQITIEQVTTQVVAGVKIDIDFIAKYLDNSDGYKCHSNVWQRLWLNSTIIDVNCSPLQSLGREKREIIGGKTPQDPNNPEYLSLARMSLSQYLNEQDISNRFQITIEQVTKQVVAGFKTEIDFVAKYLDNSGGYKCHSNILGGLLLNSTRMEVDCTTLLLLGGKKRENLFVGGKTSHDLNNPKYLSLARKSLGQYLQVGDTSKQFKIKIKRVTTQLVAGNILDIDFVAKSLNSSGEYKCHSNIWERVWLQCTIIKVNCSPLYQEIGRRTSRNAATPQKKNQDPSDPKYHAFAEKSLSQYLHLEGPSNQHQITVEHVSTTIVSGLLTEIYFIALEKQGYNALGCNSKIWEQAWLNSTKLEVTCNRLPRQERSIYDTLTGNNNALDEDRKRNQRSIDSSKIFSDQSNPTTDNDDLVTADLFANEALKYIDAKYRHPRQMKVISIISFTKDHSSAHYIIKMEAGYTNCLALSPKVETCSLVSDMGANKFCRVSVWLQPKGNKPQRYEVSCDVDENLIEINKKTQAEHLFFEFLVTHKPAYINNFDEMRRRLDIFKQNIERIHELNTHERGTARYAVTMFSDLKYEEFSTKYLGLKPYLASSNFMTKANIPNVALPANFDWREKGAVTEVKNQKQCGSCWAFSVTGNIEGQWKLKSGQLVSLSEQELVDCDTLDQGCSGGLPDNAYRAIKQLGGLEAEQDYPYEAENDKCNYNKTLSKVQISGAVNITSNETAMAMWMVEHGPISIGMNANGMQFYVGGVSHPWKVLCNPQNLDHGVLIVGYGTKDYPLFKKSLPYWIIKNSWGPNWGEQGYYRLYRGDGSCGVDQMASSAVIN